jgi:hypothetical protein
MIRSAVSIVLVAVTLNFALAQNDSINYYFGKAKQAKELKNYPEFYTMISKAHKLHPYHPNILLQTAIASALIGKEEQAIKMLGRTLHVKANIDLDNPDLEALRSTTGFAALKSLQEDLMKTVVQSDTAFVIPDRTVHIECIATGERKNIFYAGSINKRKILRIENGKTSEFISEGQDGLASVFGIKVDAKQNVLWACASPMNETGRRDSTDVSAVYKFDLRSGKLLAKYLPEGFNEYVFGDLVISPQGMVIVSDSKNNILFTVNEETKKLDKYFESKDFWNIQGISFNKSGSALYISDYIKGVFQLDTKTKTLRKLREAFDLSTKSIDGLTYYENSLIAIQNYIVPMRVTQYLMNENGDLKSYRIIDKAHPAFNEPTIGCISGDTFYYVANSAWSGYEKDFTLKPPDQLHEPVVLMVNLKKLK